MFSNYFDAILTIIFILTTPIDLISIYSVILGIILYLFIRKYIYLSIFSLYCLFIFNYYFIYYLK